MGVGGSPIPSGPSWAFKRLACWRAADSVALHWPEIGCWDGISRLPIANTKLFYGMHFDVAAVQHILLLAYLGC